MVSKKISALLIAAGVLAIAALAWMLDPIPQPLEYHRFADRRTGAGVHNAGDVLSNIPLGLAGIWGLFLLLLPGKVRFAAKEERYLWIGVAIGLILTAAGSGYYHLAPDNFRLVWDRLAMVVIFMSLIAALLGERFSVILGLWAWPVLSGVGLGSVLLWYASELRGEGDLRLYFSLQALTLLLLLVMAFTPSPYDRRRDLVAAAAFFGLAHLCEVNDHQIYDLSGGIVSGHTLKHLAAAMAGMWLIRMLWKRNILRGTDGA